jgi:hypothetical protein
MITAKTINEEVGVGDLVLSSPHGQYGSLVGVVFAIKKAGTPEHETDNPGDDIHVNFAASDYSPERKEEIVRSFAHTGKGKNFNELPLDDVIMSGEMLMKLSEIGQTDMRRMLISATFANKIFLEAENNSIEHLRASLTNRVRRNAEEYQTSLANVSTTMLIADSHKIAAHLDAETFLCDNEELQLEEIQFLLQFENPLKIIADCWRYQIYDNTDLSYTLDYVMETQDIIIGNYLSFNDYNGEPHRYMGVVLIKFFGEISRLDIIHYPNDWDVDIKSMRGDSCEIGKPYVWHVSSCGTHLKAMRDVFVKDSGAYEYMSDYRVNDPDMFGFVFVITSKMDGQIIGNAFDVGDYSRYAKYLKNVALPLDNVTLHYTDDWGVNAGKTITVSRKEYDDDRERLMCDSGNVSRITCNPQSEERLTELLSEEHNRLMALPVGNTQNYIKYITKELSELRGDKETEIDETPTQKPSVEQKLKAATERVKSQEHTQNAAKKSKKQEIE